MRIISGIYGGRNLIGKMPRSIRPTTDFARESLFDTLCSIINIQGKIFLDLFAGSGAIGLEALSRGADMVYFIDKSKESLIRIKKNIEYLEIPKDKFKIFQSEAIEFLSILCNLEKFDIIFADPPYNFEYLWKICDLAMTKEILNDNGIIIYETESKRNEIIHPDFQIIKQKVSGNAKFYFIEKITYNK